MNCINRLILLKAGMEELGVRAWKPELVDEIATVLCRIVLRDLSGALLCPLVLQEGVKETILTMLARGEKVEREHLQVSIPKVNSRVQWDLCKRNVECLWTVNRALQKNSDTPRDFSLLLSRSRLQQSLKPSIHVECIEMTPEESDIQEVMLNIPQQYLASSFD